MGKLVVSSFSLPGPAITQGPPVVAEPVLEAHRTDSLATPTVVVKTIITFPRHIFLLQFSNLKRLTVFGAVGPALEDVAKSVEGANKPKQGEISSFCKLTKFILTHQVLQ